MTAPREKYRETRRTTDRTLERGEITQQDRDLIFELCAAYDPQDMTASRPNRGDRGDDTKYKKPTTLLYWMQHLRRVARRLDYEPYNTTLADASSDDINQLMTDIRSGSHPDIKDSGQANNTVRNTQGCMRRFYRYHHDLGVDPDDITIIQGDDTHIDDRDMLTKEEIDKIRECVEHPRDLAIFDLLLYTGQRNTAIRSLRIKDVDLDNGIYYLNETADGLKGADKNGSKRPLLGAVGAVREWLRYHPFADNPDAYLITPKPRYSNPEPDVMVSINTMTYTMNKIKEKAGIDKPMNPHSIRHNFVTISKREYKMDDATVKHLIGHSPDSQVMETTYSHLSDEDHIRAAEEAAGIREPDDDSILSPDICHCGEPLPTDAKACSRCGTIYTPDAKAVEDRIDDQIKESYKQTEPSDIDTQEKIEKLDGLLDDPDVKAALLEKLQE